MRAVRMRFAGMADLGFAIDAYITDLALRGRRPATLASYQRLLHDLMALVPDKATQELTLHDYERFLGRWVGASPSTLASGVSLVRGFSRFLFERGLAEDDIARALRRPRRKRPEELDVVSVSDDDVRKMLAACRDWQEYLCLSTAICLGARRRALSRVRRGDVDLVHGTIRFLEKGGKVIVKPLPDEYQRVLVEAERHGLWKTPHDYLIPSRRPGAVRRAERSDKVIWQTVKAIAERAGVRSHVHALRAAFAVRYDAQHPGHIDSLKELMGHSRIETTIIYLRRKDRAAAMETVRDLSWGLSGFESRSEKGAHMQGEAHTGFEPVLAESRLPEPLRTKLDELGTRARRRRKAER